MSIKLTQKQLQILVNAIHSRINELNNIIDPLLTELEEHEAFLLQHNNIQPSSFSKYETNQGFEVLPWSKKITQVLLEAGKLMSTNEIVAEIVNRIPGLAQEQSTRSSIASILSRRSGKLFKKVDDKYGLIDWSD